MTPPFDAATPDELLRLLPEQHPLYDGKSTNEAARIRSSVLAAFARTGLPDAPLPYVLEELESGQQARLVAAAARALRGGQRNPAFASFLRKAERNIAYTDVPVTLDAGETTSAMEEIGKTRAWLGAAAEDCCAAFAPDRARRTAGAQVALEDQDGRPLRFGDFFRGRLSVVAFFYTRCDNPEKCSLTITKLARLQQAIESGPLRGRVRLAAITYDPLYDLPSRLRAFGEARGVRFDDDVRFFRAPEGLDALRDGFDLGVGFAGPVPNRHRIELYVLNARGETVAAFTRLQWEVDAVVAELRSQLAPAAPVATALPPLALALLPKCPLCLGAYVSAAGLGGLQTLLHARWTIPLSIALLLLHLWTVHRRSRRTGHAAPLVAALAGAAALLGGALSSARPLAIAGAALLVIASLLASHRMSSRA